MANLSEIMSKSDLSLSSVENATKLHTVEAHSLLRCFCGRLFTESSERRKRTATKAECSLNADEMRGVCLATG